MTQSPTARIAADVGILVTDMDKSLSFYSDLLELPVIAEITTSLIGRGKMIQLQHGESLIKLVKLEDGPNRPNEDKQPSGISAAYGIRYITLMVTNIIEIMERVEQGGATIALPLTELGNGATIAMAADPDGNIVEFVQEVEALMYPHD